MEMPVQGEPGVQRCCAAAYVAEYAAGTGMPFQP